MTSKPHYLIVGAGLSGVLVSFHLIQKGAKVTLVDKGVNHSSAIAAGMINPLVFRHMTKGWRVDDCIPYLHEFYPELEKVTGASFFHPIQIRRMFSSERGRDLWLKKQLREDFAPYMHEITKEDDAYDQVKNDFGSARLKQAAYVDTAVFLSEMKKWIAENAEFFEKDFDYHLLQGTKYEGVNYDHIIFCEGYLGVHNPWFGYLPLNQTKGETLNIESTAIPQDESVNRKCFILPLGNHQFKVGSTYVWHTATTNPTEEGKNEILQKMSYLTDAPLKVVGHAAGVRPTVDDRRPLIGTHADHPNYHIFNGLGTKGYLLAPLLSNEFVDYLVDGQELLAEVDIRRFAHRSN